MIDWISVLSTDVSPDEDDKSYITIDGKGCVMMAFGTVEYLCSAVKICNTTESKENEK